MSDKTGVLDKYYLEEALKASAKKLGERCGIKAVEMLARRLAEYIGSVEEDQYSYIWRSAVEDHEQDAYKDDTRSVLVDAVRDAALGATSNGSATASDTGRFLLQSTYPTHIRVGIYVCGEHYGNIGAIFWECAQHSWFSDVTYWHELYWFIKKNFSKFSAAERNHFLAFVDQLKGDLSDSSQQEEWDETYKRDLLHPAFGLGDPEVDSKYQALVQRWGPVRDHPDFHSYTTSGWPGDRSPVQSDALVLMSNDELVNFLKSFTPESGNWNGPTYRGVALSISSAVRASEDGFASRIALFADLARPYQHGLLSGLKERWHEDKRDIEWPATISLLQAIVSSQTFKADLEAAPPEAWEPTVQWVVSDIADLLKSASGTERTLPTQLRKPCIEILRRILSSITPTGGSQSNDAVSHAINAPRGRVLEAFIHLSLAMRREEIKADSHLGETWSEVGPTFETELATSECGLNADFATMAGMYCANLHYINSEWTEANFHRLFSSTNESAWRCAAQGFSYQRYMYDWLFKKLAEGGHLRKMIYSEGISEQVTEKALQFLSLAYLEDIEKLEGTGLLSELIIDLKTKALSHLCWFFWTLRSENNVSPRAQKILAFWLKVAEQARSSRADFPDLQSAMSQLAIFVHEVTPAIAQALIESAPHAQVKYHGYMLIENLARLVSQYPKDIATIFRAAMAGFLPEYKEEDVIRCVMGMAAAGEIEAAEQICNTYAERGSTLLKETYEILRAQQRSSGGT